MSDLDLAIAIAKAKKAKGGQTAPAERTIGQRLWENIVGDDDPTTQNFGEKVGTLLNMGGEAMTFGLVGDEASAAVESLVPGVKYEDRRDHYRQQQRIMEQEHPFLSLAAQVGGAMALPFGVVGAGGNALRALGRGVGIGIGAGGTWGFMEGEGGLSDRAKSAGGGAIGGAIGGALAVPIGKAVSWAAQKGGRALSGVFRNRRLFNGASLTDEGRETLRALGYNPDEISDAFAREFQRGTREAMEPAQAGRAAELAEFSIPAYRANVTGLADDFAALERGRRGAIGPITERKTRAALDAQDEAMRRAGDDIALRVGGGKPADQFDAAVGAMDGLRKARDTTLGAARRAYDELGNIGAGVRGTQVSRMGTNLRRSVEVAGTYIDDTATPNARAAFETLDRAFANADTGSVPFMDLERARQQLVQLRAAAFRGSLGADQTAMRAVVNAFDDRVDDLMTSALTQGDEAVIKAAEKARGLWREYSQKFTGKSAPSRFIQELIDNDASPDQAVKWLFSSGRLGTGRFNSTLAKGLRDTLGETSEEWNAIRQAAFRQMIQKPEGMTQWGPQKISENLSGFINGPATRDLSKTLFSGDELALMRRYAGALKRLVPPPGAVNYSGTSYENQRAARASFQALASMFGFANGGPVGAVAAGGAVRATQTGGDWLASRALLSRAPVTPGTSRLAAPLGIQGGNAGSYGANMLNFNRPESQP
jgi:hypothetical protein